LLTIVTQGKVGESYNVGGRNERTNLQVVEAICDILDDLVPTQGLKRRDLITFVTDRPGHDQRYAIDASKLENELYWRAQNDFDTGLRKTIAWYIDRQDWWGPLRERYDGQRLGLAKVTAG
jgi:dTDP-glucose 4,6-dehydratase